MDVPIVSPISLLAAAPSLLLARIQCRCPNKLAEDPPARGNMAIATCGHNSTNVYIRKYVAAVSAI